VASSRRPRRAALRHGLAAGHAIADFLNGKSEDPSGGFVGSYPGFRTKQVLRFLFDHFQSDAMFDLLLGTKPMRMAASLIYFHHKGVFETPATARGAGTPKISATKP
jgi:hypothetical protein